jgi:hypothetical protein
MYIKGIMEIHFSTRIAPVQSRDGSLVRHKTESLPAVMLRFLKLPNGF